MSPSDYLLRLGCSPEDIERIEKAIAASAVPMNLSVDEQVSYLVASIRTSEAWAKSQHDEMLHFLSLSEEERYRRLADAVRDEVP